MPKLIAAAVWVLAVLSSGCQSQPRRDAPAREPLFINAPGAPLDVGSRPNDLALADFNGDGKLDVVTCNDGDTVTVWLGDGRAGFAPAPGPPLRAAAHLVAAGDVNGDGRDDIITGAGPGTTGGSPSTGVWFLRNSGTAG